MKKLIKFVDQKAMDNKILMLYKYLHNYYWKYNLRRWLKAHNFYNDIVLSNYTEVNFFEDLNITYNHMRKSGNSNILIILYSILENINSNHYKNLKNTQKFKTTQSFMRKNFQGLHKYKLDSNFASRLSQSNKFTFVRNPYIRAVSMFRDKIINSNYFPKIFNNIPDNAYGFAKFVDFLENGGMKKNKHFFSQYDQLFFEVSEFDFIGKLENFSTDFINMLEKFQIDFSDKTFNLIHNRKNTTHVTESEKHYKKYFNRDLASRIYILYEIDFINFGYKKEIFDE